MAENLKTCSTCIHWTGNPERRYVINWHTKRRDMIETRLCQIPVTLPEWANLAKHTDYNRTSETDGRDCECWVGEAQIQTSAQAICGSEEVFRTRILAALEGYAELLDSGIESYTIPGTDQAPPSDQHILDDLRARRAEVDAIRAELEARA